MPRTKMTIVHQVYPKKERWIIHTTLPLDMHELKQELPKVCFGKKTHWAFDVDKKRGKLTVAIERQHIRKTSTTQE